jgi:hypothetical protein
MYTLSREVHISLRTVMNSVHQRFMEFTMKFFFCITKGTFVERKKKPRTKKFVDQNSGYEKKLILAY